MEEYIERVNREVLSTRTIDPKISKQLGIRPIKGVLLHGPPGVGKTLIAVQIGKSLNTEPPIIISGPSLISKWIGESEKNIRDIFAKARSDQLKGKKNLHLVIFDEFDSIGIRRSENDIHGTYNNIVNQLLSMMDGPEALNNIIIIAITNRIDTLDEALLRPGRFEVHVEIKMPNLNQRRKIIEVKTNKLLKNGFLDYDFDIEEITNLTANYSGADIEGLVNKVVSDMIYEKLNNNLPGIISQNDFLKYIVEKKPPISKPENLQARSLIEKLISADMF